MASTTDATASKTHEGRNRDGCICNWDDCKQMREIFAARLNDGQDEIRGGPAVRLHLEGDGRKKSKWRDAVVTNLHATAANIKDWTQVFVVRHHWSVDQLKYFFGGEKRRRPGTPVPIDVMKSLADPFDPEDQINENNKVLYFHSPNHPHEQVQTAAFGSKERNNRSQIRQASREMQLAAYEQKRQDDIVKRRRLEFENLTVETYNETICNMEERLRLSALAEKEA